MGLKLISGFFALLLIIPFVSATDTIITIKTNSFYKTSLFVLDDHREIYTLLNSYHKYSDAYGTNTFTYSGPEDTIKLRIQIADENGRFVNLTSEHVYYEMSGVKTGGHLYLQMIPGNISENYMESQPSSPPAEENEDANKTVNDTVVETIGGNSDAKNTGQTISGGINLNWNNALAISGIVIGISIIFFFGFKILKKVKKKDHYFDPDQATSLHKLEVTALENELYNAQKKLKEAQIEINKIKNRDKIAAAEKKLEEDKRELEKLRQGF